MGYKDADIFRMFERVELKNKTKTETHRRHSGDGKEAQGVMRGSASVLVIISHDWRADRTSEKVDSEK